MLGGRAGWLARPWFFVAIALLALNDHVLKAAWPGWATGKLSDFAGLVVVGTLASVGFGHRCGTVLAALGFLALKTVPGVAETVAPLLGGVTLRDASDLIALTVLPVLWWRLGRERPGQAARTRRGWQAVGLVAAVLATTGTSQAPGDRVAALWFARDAFYASVQLTGGDVFLRSSDGGSTWVLIDQLPAAVSQPKPPDKDMECSPQQTCYRIGYNFEEVAGQSTAHGYNTIDRRSRGGEWVPEFRFEDEASPFDLAVNPEDPDQAMVAQHDSRALRRVGPGDWAPVDLVALAGGSMKDPASRQDDASRSLFVMAVVVALPWVIPGAAVLCGIALVVFPVARRHRGFDPPEDRTVI